MEDYTWPGNVRELRNITERIIILGKGKRIDLRLIQEHMGLQPEVDSNLPVILHKTSDQAERELIYRALIEIRMAVEELRSLALGRAQSTRMKPDHGYPLDTNTVQNGNAGKEDNLNIVEMEKNLIKKALERFRRNRRKAARVLGIGERTLYRKLKEYDLEDY